MKVSIIGGAGTLGSAVAFRLSQVEKITEVCLIDVNESLLMNHIMDMENAFPTQLITKGSYENLKGSEIIIITAGVPNRNDIESRDVFLEGNINIFKQFGENIKSYAPEALIITASNPVDALNYYLYRTYEFEPSQLLGYTLNDSLRFESSLRSVMNISREDDLFTPVIGEHGSTQVPLFSQVQLNGKRMKIRDVDQKVIKEKNDSWFIKFNQLNIDRTTGWTTAAGIGRIVEGLLMNESIETIGSIILNGEYGIQDISIGSPITVNLTGINSIRDWNLSELELTDFQRSAEKIKQLIQPYI